MARKMHRHCTFRAITSRDSVFCVREHGSHGAGAVSILVTEYALEMTSLSYRG